MWKDKKENEKQQNLADIPPSSKGSTALGKEVGSELSVLP